MDSLETKVAVITGASTGIGRRIAVDMAANDARVVIGDIQKRPAEADRYGSEADRPTATLIQDRGGTASYKETDVADPSDCRSLIDHTLEEYGRIDVLVNNAGIHVPGSVEELSPADWADVLHVNLFGSFYCSKFAVPHLRETDGSIINISSVHAIEGGSGPAYASSKAGLTNMTRDLATSLGEYNITVNAICPGFVKTPRQDYLSDAEIEDSREQTLLPRLGTPEDVADAAVFLASDRASWITGESLFVDGGWTAHRGV